MDVPLPHASFPLGDAIPLTVTLHTDEAGTPWAHGSLGDKDALECRVEHPTGAAHDYELLPVTGRPSAYTAEVNTHAGHGYARGLYRYAVTLGRKKSEYGTGYARRYTLLRGTFTLY